MATRSWFDDMEYKWPPYGGGGTTSVPAMDSRGIRRSVVSALFVAMVLLAGCGNDSASESPDAIDDGSGADDGDDASGESGDTNGSAAEGGGESDNTAVASDEDFPIPIPDGVLLDAHADVGLAIDNQRSLFYSADDADRLVGFFDDWTSQSDGTWARTELEDTVSFTRTDGEFGSIVITPDHDPGAQADGPVTLLALAVG